MQQNMHFMHYNCHLPLLQIPGFHPGSSVGLAERRARRENGEDSASQVRKQLLTLPPWKTKTRAAPAAVSPQVSPVPSRVWTTAL